MASQPERIVVGYVGEPPATQLPHGSCRCDAESFICTKPEITDRLRTALEHLEHPMQVYDRQQAVNDSFDVPRNYKQVINLGQMVATGPGGSGSIRNPADDVLAVLNAVQENDFVQSCILNKGKLPISFVVCRSRYRTCVIIVHRWPPPIYAQLSASTGPLISVRALSQHSYTRTWLSYAISHRSTRYFSGQSCFTLTAKPIHRLPCSHIC